MPDPLWKRLEATVPEKARAEFIRQAVEWALDLRGVRERLEKMEERVARLEGKEPPE